MFQHSINIDLVYLGWVKYTIGNTPNHKVKQINIKVISNYDEVLVYQTFKGENTGIWDDFIDEPEKNLTKNYKITFFKLH